MIRPWLAALSLPLMLAEIGANPGGRGFPRPRHGAARSAPIVRVDVLPSPGAPGEPLFVKVLIERADRVRGVPFHLLYPTRLLEFESAEAGPFLDAPSGEVVFMAAGPPGHLFVALSRSGNGRGASGAGLLCTLRFRAKTAGTAVLEFEDAHVFVEDHEEKGARFVPLRLEIR